MNLGVEFLKAVFALVVTLALVGLAAVAVRRFGPEWVTRLQRKPTDRRLAIIESLTLDPQRRLVLVRMDDQERLLLLGEGRVLAEARAAPPRPETQV